MKPLFSYRLRRLRRALLFGLVRRYSAFKRIFPAITPLAVQHFDCGEEPASELMIFLPGVGDVLEDFERNRFMAAVCASKRPADMVVVDVHAGYYLHANVLERLHEDVIAPARASGHRSIWLVGISLGGFGALLYAMENTKDVQGLMLLAPYLGERALIAEIAAAGALRSWQPDEVATGDHTRRLWSWIKRVYATSHDGPAPRVYLGYGNRDSFARGNALLAEHLPADRVFVIPGGHDWKTWRELWRAMLARRDAETPSPLPERAQGS